MKSIFTLAIVAGAMTVASSCTFIRISDQGFASGMGQTIVADGDMKTVEYDVDQFTGIESWLAADVSYTVTDGNPSVEVSAPESIIDDLRFGVEDGVLLIQSKDNRNYRAKIKVAVKSATLERLDIRGAGDFNALSDIDTKSLAISIKGAGDVDFEDVRCEGDVSITVEGAGDIGFYWLECNDIKVDVMGAGDVRLAGKAENADLSIKGAGEVDIRSFTVRNDLSTSVAGVGSIKKK